jgi:hypothetical protein
MLVITPFLSPVTAATRRALRFDASVSQQQTQEWYNIALGRLHIVGCLPLLFFQF